MVGRSPPWPHATHPPSTQSAAAFSLDEIQDEEICDRPQSHAAPSSTKPKRDYVDRQVPLFSGVSWFIFGPGTVQRYLSGRLNVMRDLGALVAKSCPPFAMHLKVSERAREGVAISSGFVSVDRP